jgi:hypothetical protein
MIEARRVRLAMAMGERPQGTPAGAWEVVIMQEGEANGLYFPFEVLRQAAAHFAGAPVFVDHATAADRARPGGRSVRDLVGLVAAPAADPAQRRVTARLHLMRQAGWLRELIAQLGAHPHILGLSADVWLRSATSPSRGKPTVASIDAVNSVDIVVNPAAGGRFLVSARHTQAKEADCIMDGLSPSTRVQTALDAVQPHNRPKPPDDTLAQEAAAGTSGAGASGALGSGAGTSGAEVELATLRAELLEVRLAQSRLPESLKATARRLAVAAPDAQTALAAVGDLERQWADATAQAAIRGLGQVTSVRSGLDRAQLAFERLMGLPETAAHREAGRLSGIRELYDLLTGDWERHGVYRADRVTLANATTSTMAQVVANVLNKVMLQSYEARQWWRAIVHEEDFPSMQEVKWITVGGFGDLDTVAEGDAYTEKTWDDAAETATFVKKGNYIGVTLEMIDRDDVAAVRAIPRRLGVAANRTLSAAIAALFTANSGVGPTLADGKALFHADHGNLGSAALDDASWRAAVQAMFKQAEFHSAKRLGVRPSYCLAPIELEPTAVGLFTTALEPGLAGNTRAIEQANHSVITVPEWTDADDWAAVAAPSDLEGICIGYRFGRGPEIFVADGDLMGTMFTNDEMRAKVRFVYALGIGDYRALYKAKVTA